MTALSWRVKTQMTDQQLSTEEYSRFVSVLDNVRPTGSPRASATEAYLRIGHQHSPGIPAPLHNPIMRHGKHFLGQSATVDQNNRVLIFDNFALNLLGEVTCRDVNAEPAPL